MQSSREPTGTSAAIGVTTAGATAGGAAAAPPPPPPPPSLLHHHHHQQQRSFSASAPAVPPSLPNIPPVSPGLHQQHHLHHQPPNTSRSIPSIDELRNASSRGLTRLNAPNLTTYIEHYRTLSRAPNLSLFLSLTISMSIFLFHHRRLLPFRWKLHRVPGS